MNLTESRYDRAERITWWDQSLLGDARVLVVGAGALGNEIVKNLTLVGVGSIDVVDMDSIEYSNLSRCVFFRDGDEGQSKAELLVSRALQLNPDVTLQSFNMPVQQLGAAYLGGYSAVVGALDNREARLWTSRACRMNGIPFIDAAIEGLHAVVRIFSPDTACYACTLSDVDWEVLNKRRSCALLQRDDIALGKTPTNATTSSVAAAIQCQELIKYLVNRSDLISLNGKVWHLMGEELANFTVEMTLDPNCMEHIEFDEIIRSDITNWLTLSEALEPFFSETTGIWTLDDFVFINSCEQGHMKSVAGFRSLLKSSMAYCQKCDVELETISTSVLTQDFPGLSVPREQVIWPKSEFLLLSEGATTRALVIERGES